MRHLLLLLAAFGLAFAPAPFPKPARRTPALTMAGVWDVKWSGSGVRLDLRPDGSARFAYTSGGGVWDGTWRYDEGVRRVTLTLMIGGQGHDYEMTFDKIERDAAEGKVRQGSPRTWPVKMARMRQQ